MAFTFQKASKKTAKLRLAIFGPSGSGKTFTSLRMATGLGGNIAVIDTERGSASKYADRFEFDVLELPKKDIETYIEAIQAAGKAGYGVLVIDSMSHAWQELLEDIDRMASTKFSGNTWAAWSKGTPKQKSFVEAILNFPGHIISTMRVKTEWVEGEDSKGRKKYTRVGLNPEQGKGIEYEFDLLMEINVDHTATVLKDRTGKFQDKIITKPGEDFGRELADWLNSGAPETKPAAQPEAKPEPKAEFAPAATKPAEQPKPANGNGKMSVADAVKAKSPGGKEFSTLTVEQLKQVKASTDPKVTPEMKQAAETLLAPVDDWLDLDKLCDRAAIAGIEEPTIDRSVPIARITLFQEMVKLQKQLDDLAIPVEFQ
jgi:hypothetical protein